MCVCVCERVQEVLWTKEGMCSERYKEGMSSERDKGVLGKGQMKGCVPFLTRVGTRKGRQGKVFANGCQRALTQKQTLWGGGALEVGDLRLVEDGSQRSGTLGPCPSDIVASETASEG